MHIGQSDSLWADFHRSAARAERRIEELYLDPHTERLKRIQQRIKHGDRKRIGLALKRVA